MGSADEETGDARQRSMTTPQRTVDIDNIDVDGMSMEAKKELWERLNVARSSQDSGRKEASPTKDED